MPIQVIFIITCLLLLAGTVLAAQRISGRPATVFSGNELLLAADTGELYRIRLAGILVERPKGKWGAAAKRHLQMLVLGKNVQFVYQPQRMSGTVRGQLLHGGADIGERLLQAGLARLQAEPKLSQQLARHYADAENRARQAGAGIWRERRQRAVGRRQYP